MPAHPIHFSSSQFDFIFSKLNQLRIKKTIYGFINPAKKGGILDLINHAPDRNELAYFDFQKPKIKENAATSNLKITIKFYNGYAIMGLEESEDIEGGKQGQQLLCS